MKTNSTLTTQQIDDGWILEPVSEDRAPASAFEEAFWEQHEGKKLGRRFGEVPSTFGKIPRKRAVRPPLRGGA